MKTTKILLSTVLALALIGCDSSDTTADLTDTTADAYTEETNQARELLDAMYADSEVSDDTYAMTQSIDTDTQATSREAGDGTFNCVQSGTFAFENWNRTLVPLEVNVDVVLSACNNGYFVTDGTVNFNVSQLENDVWQYAQTFVTDYTLTTDEAVMTIAAASMAAVRGEKLANDYESETSYTATVTNEYGTYTSRVESWVHHHTVAPVSWYPVSGRLYLDETHYYDVYDGYDASATPFVFDDGIAQPGGESQYIGKGGDLFKFVVESTGTVAAYYDPDGVDGPIGFIKLSDFLK